MHIYYIENISRNYMFISSLYIYIYCIYAVDAVFTLVRAHVCSLSPRWFRREGVALWQWCHELHVTPAQAEHLEDGNDRDTAWI